MNRVRVRLNRLDTELLEVKESRFICVVVVEEKRIHVAAQANDLWATIFHLIDGLQG